MFFHCQLERPVARSLTPRLLDRCQKQRLMLGRFYPAPGAKIVPIGLAKRTPVLLPTMLHGTKTQNVLSFLRLFYVISAVMAPASHCTTAWQGSVNHGCVRTTSHYTAVTSPVSVTSLCVVFQLAASTRPSMARAWKTASTTTRLLRSVHAPTARGRPAGWEGVMQG